MPRPRTGQASFRNGKWYARVTLGPNDRPTFELNFTRESDGEAATARASMLAELGAALVRGGQREQAAELLRRAAVASDPTMRKLLAAARAGRLAADIPRDAITFKQLATLWTSGDLARRHPDHVKVKRTADDDVQRLEHHVFPIVGSVPIASFTLDHAEQVMAAMPTNRARNTRRNIAVIVHRVLGLAVFPMRLIAANPIPRGWLPSPGTWKALTFLYPDEDAKLLACGAVPLAHRVLYGLLSREGMRKGEARALRWRDVDLERGAVALDENKTDDPRAWALAPDVAAVLAGGGRRAAAQAAMSGCSPSSATCSHTCCAST
jgi:integrase